MKISKRFVLVVGSSSVALALSVWSLVGHHPDLLSTQDAIFGLFFAVSSGLFAFSQARAEAAAARPAPTPLLSKIAQLRSILGDSAQLAAEINTELELRASELERLTAEVEQKQLLAELNADQAEAVQERLQAIVEGAHAETARVGTRQQWRIFLLGAFTSPFLGVVGSYLFEYAKAHF